MNNTERKVRVAAMRKNWLSTAKLWKSKDVTMEAKRTVFCSRVREAGISGLEAYVLDKADTSSLEKKTCSNLEETHWGSWLARPVETMKAATRTTTHRTSRCEEN